MKIKIAHLYYDLMNLYGENANVRALEKAFKDQGIEVETSLLTINDKIDFDTCDIYYMGMGSEESELLVLKDIFKYKENIKSSIESNKYFFMTGNSYELFGQYLLDSNKTKINCLGMFDYYTEISSLKELKNASTLRIVGEASGKSSLIPNKIIGFQNRSGLIYNNNSPLFELYKGIGTDLKNKFEGYTYKNFYGTYLIGPLFIRNPYLTNYFVKKIISEKNGIYKDMESTEEIKAYEKYLENFPK